MFTLSRKIRSPFLYDYVINGTARTKVAKVLTILVSYLTQSSYSCHVNEDIVSYKSVFLFLERKTF